LNELVAALDGASNKLISVEDLSENELHVLAIHYKLLAEMARRETDVRESHSVEEAETRHHLKRDRRQRVHARFRRHRDPVTPPEPAPRTS
jgi:low affinity Fe/Cu permease